MWCAVFVETVAEHQGITGAVGQEAGRRRVRHDLGVEKAVVHVYYLVVDQLVAHVEDEHGIGDRGATLRHLGEIAVHGHALAP